MLLAANQDAPEECQRYLAAAGRAGVIPHRRSSSVQRTWNEKDGHNVRSLSTSVPHAVDTVTNPGAETRSAGQIHFDSLSPVRRRPTRSPARATD